MRGGSEGHQVGYPQIHPLHKRKERSKEKRSYYYVLLLPFGKVRL
jgi:hypothetical protein